MPVEISWHLEDRVGYVKYQANVTVEDLYSAAEQAAKLIDSSRATLVHFIHDGSEMTYFPRHLASVIKGMQAHYSHPRIGWVVAFKMQDNFVRFTSNVVAQVYHVRYRQFDEQQEALEFLQTRDSTLPSITKLRAPLSTR